MKQSIEALLSDLGIIDSTRLEEYSSRTRDRKDIRVFRCRRSGVIYLKDAEHVAENYYQQESSSQYFRNLNVQDGDSLTRQTLRDDKRRVKYLANFLSNKQWLDVGSGFGGILQLGKKYTNKITAVEPQEDAALFLRSRGFSVYSNLADVNTENNFDIITLFHVFEHMISPLEDLKKLNSLLRIDGKIVIEVPHASDILLKFFELGSFKDFTLWSEHLILHTRESLKTFLEASDFKNVIVEGVQRYPISNHLHWLAKQKAGGHEKWFFLNDPELNTVYKNLLSRLDMTDTLLAVAEKQNLVCASK
jgi:2-polyprenyl-3-methyl-5-hydroxy-6-metoxy-1,4-benzoquinol methylase